MFEVTSRSPIDEEWESRDQFLFTTAGRKSDVSSASWHREHVWFVKEFTAAEKMKDRLNSVPLVEATVRERITEQRKKKFKK